ncbi:MAG: uridine phosphorylase [Clostridia bacterium]|nr:uridine phosphorylase [Clostridia bacterium]
MKERIYHLALEQPQSEYAILPGDPGRVEKIARFLKDPVKLAQNREFVTWAGELSGRRVLVTSTGIGGPSAAIAMEELAQLGVKTFIRVGTCGGMQTQVLGGDLILPTGAVRMEGTSKEYLPVEFPAVPDFAVLSALAGAARQSGARFHTGVVQSKDSFYGQHEPKRMPVGPELEFKWEAFIRGGALASEMECAALFTVAACLQVRAGAVLLCVWNQERARAGLDNPEVMETDGAIMTALDAVRLLMAQE